MFIIFTNDGESNNFVEPKAYLELGKAIWAAGKIADTMSKQIDQVLTRDEHSNGDTFPAAWCGDRGASVTVKRIELVS